MEEINKSTMLANLENEEFSNLDVKNLIDNLIKDASYSVFSSDIIHEIKNGLAVIQGFNNMIQKKTNDSELMLFSYEIDLAAASINEFIEEYVSFMKENKLNLESFNTKHMLEKVHSQFQIHTNLSINIIGNCSVKANITFFKQIIFNLIKNALEESERRNLHCTIEFRIYKQEETVVIEVEDNCREIDYDFDKDILSIFRPQKGDGFGVGLFSCRKLAMYQEGTLEIIDKKFIRLTFSEGE